MLSLKASKSPRPCGSQQTKLNIAGLESFNYSRPFASFGYILKVLLFMPSQYYVTCFRISISRGKIFFGIQLSQLIRQSSFFFFFTWNYTQEGTRLRVLKQLPFCANAYTGSIQPCFLCMCFHTSEQKMCGNS